MKFNFQYIHPSLWGSNCRDILTKDSWQTVKYKVHELNNNKCQMCLRTLDTKLLQAHEAFDINQLNINIYEFKLVKIISLCELCHNIVHIKIPMAQGQDKLNELKSHMGKHKNFEYNKVIFNEKLDKYLKIKYSNLAVWKLDLNYVMEFAKKHDIQLESNYSKVRYYDPEYTKSGVIKLKKQRSKDDFKILFK